LKRIHGVLATLLCAASPIAFAQQGDLPFCEAGVVGDTHQIRAGYFQDSSGHVTLQQVTFFPDKKLKFMDEDVAAAPPASSVWLEYRGDLNGENARESIVVAFYDFPGARDQLKACGTFSGGNWDLETPVARTVETTNGGKQTEWRCTMDSRFYLYERDPEPMRGEKVEVNFGDREVTQPPFISREVTIVSPVVARVLIPIDFGKDVLNHLSLQKARMKKRYEAGECIPRPE
jgi:hypothetical protein